MFFIRDVRLVSQDGYVMSESHTAPDVSVVIPCYNEEKNIERKKLEEVKTYLTHQPYTWEVIVVNDGSTDNSSGLMHKILNKDPFFSLVDAPHGGKPRAIRTGIQKARGDILVFTDMDQSTPISELDKLMTGFDEGYDVVIGSRRTVRRGFSVFRKMGSIVFKFLRRLFILRNINDTQCGFKACRRDAAEKTFERLQYFRQNKEPAGWKVSAYDVELLHLFDKAGYSIKEMRVCWSDCDESDTKYPPGSNFSRYVKESVEMAHEVLRVKCNQLRGLYDDS